VKRKRKRKNKRNKPNLFFKFSSKPFFSSSFAFFTIKLLCSFSYSKVYKAIFTYIYAGESVVKHIYIELDENIHLKLKTKAYSEGKTIGQVIKRLIEKYVNGEVTL